jgi:hypothetical protein
LREVAPPEVAAPEAPVPAEIPEWLREAAPPEVAPPEVPVPAEIPEWLEEAAPPEVPPEVPRAEVPPAEPEVFGWTTFGEEVEISAPPVEEAPPLEPPFGWTAFGVEVVAPEVPPEVPVESKVPVMEVAPPTVIPPEEMRVRAPEEVQQPTPERRAERAEVAPPAPPAEALASVDALRTHVRTRPRDYEARLALARALWQARLYDDSLEAYSRLLKAGKFLEEILMDMETHAAERPRDVAVRRVLGDAYMRVGRLAELWLCIGRRWSNWNNRYPAHRMSGRALNGKIILFQRRTSWNAHSSSSNPTPYSVV